MIILFLFEQEYYKTNFNSVYDKSVFDLLEKMDEMVETLEFGKYSSLKDLVEHFLKLKRMSPIGVIAIENGSTLSLPNGDSYQIDSSKPMIDKIDYGQFIGKKKFELVKNF